MNNEIKKILDKFDKVLENYELDKKWGQMSVDSICHLFPSEMMVIKDYITNLQCDIDSYKTKYKNAKENLKVLQEELEEEKRIEQADFKTIQNLEEENERLKIEKQEEYNRFNLMAKFRDKALERTLIYKSRNENAQDLILNELSHLKANDEETWNKEFYDENNKLDYRKLCIELLNQVINLLNGGDEE